MKVHQEQAQDIPLVIATMPATGQQKAIAFGVAILLIVAAAVIAPFASIQLGRIDAFIPVLQTSVCLADIMTAALLFSQYSIQPQRALLALATGYMFSGSFAFLQTLAFPGGYSPAGLIGDGLNSPALIFSLWHATFPAGALVYALSKDATESARPRRPAMTTIAITIASAFAVIAGLTWIVTAKVEYLPAVYSTVMFQTPLANQMNVGLLLWGSVVLGVLLLRRRTILDLWLIVALLAYMPNLLVAIIGSLVRFTVGWYAGRAFVLVSSCMLLGVLLIETMFLYSRLASAITLQRRERTNRLLSVEAATAAIAHEIKQPIGSMSLNCDAALECLKATPLDLEELRSCLTDVKNDSSRANEIVTGIRALFKGTAPQRTMVEINRLAWEVLRMVEHDLHGHGISVSTEFQEDIPQVRADPIQLQQVILNLVRNAIDAIAIGPATMKAIRLVTTYDGKSVVSIYVQDTGPGITLDNETQIFDAFFSTKTSGMGLGLSISRRIIEDHGGDLRLTETSSKGCIFEVALPSRSESLKWTIAAAVK